MKNKDDRWYHTLQCGHIRMISLKAKNIVLKKTKVYCRQCDANRIVMSKTPRWDA